MRLSENLRRLIDANAPLWAGEAEIVRTYWTAPIRSRAADKLWLMRQCWKEYVGVAKGAGDALAENRLTGLARTLASHVPQLDLTVDRHDLREELEKHYVEYTHYCLFADVHDSLLEPGEPHLVGNRVEVWPEETALAQYRQLIRRAGGPLARATGFTEGGYCTLYSEGAKLKGRPGVDGRIAAACQRVFDDEFGHMMHGVVEVERQGMSAGDWSALTDATCEILRLRLHMRNAQFGRPVGEPRLHELLAGKAAPLAFDHARAESYLTAAA